MSAITTDQFNEGITVFEKGHGELPNTAFLQRPDYEALVAILPPTPRDTPPVFNGVELLVSDTENPGAVVYAVLDTFRFGALGDDPEMTLTQFEAAREAFTVEHDNVAPTLAVLKSRDYDALSGAMVQSPISTPPGIASLPTLSGTPVAVESGYLTPDAGILFCVTQSCKVS